LIPLKAGAEAMVNELSCSDPSAIEVILGSSFPSADVAPPREQPKVETARGQSSPMGLAFERVLDVEHHPFLRSHVLAGRPVLPVAMMIEWMGHAALHANPGMQWHGLDELRVLKGIVLDGSPRPIRAMAGKTRRNGLAWEVDVELRSGAADSQVAHARATVRLGGELPAADPIGILNRDGELRAYPREVSGAYADVLFHGPELRAIEQVEGLSANALVARLRCAGSPLQWMSDPLRSGWLADPLVLDGAFQAAILWCFEELGAVSLPNRIARYRQFVRTFPAGGVQLRIAIRQHSPHRMQADMDFVGLDGLVARIEGYECTVDASLHAKLKGAGGAGAEMADSVR
jgi:hypothetical protein